MKTEIEREVYKVILQLAVDVQGIYPSRYPILQDLARRATEEIVAKINEPGPKKFCNITGSEIK